MLASLVWLGILAIYLGAAGAAGTFWRRASSESAGHQYWLSAGYATTLSVGGAVLILAMPDWWLPARLLLVGAGLAVALAGMRRPGCLPQSLWRRAFGRGYLAGAMALAALWGLSQALSGPTPAPLLIALSALGAGAASSGTALVQGTRSA